jgi:hypothetical protein
VGELQQESFTKENLTDQGLDKWKCRLWHDVKVQIKA